MSEKRLFTCTKSIALVILGFFKQVLGGSLAVIIHKKVQKIKPKIRPDISNIAGYHGFPPRARNIELMFNNLRTEYWVEGIADWQLPHIIDNLHLYDYYIERGIIVEAAQGIPADIPLIKQAIQDDSLIITNDSFLDHMDIIPSESWLYRHRVPFKIYNGEFKMYFPK